MRENHAENHFNMLFDADRKIMSKATRTINYCKALKAQLKKLGQSIPEFPSLKEEILSKYDSVNNLIDRAKKSQDWKHRVV